MEILSSAGNMDALVAAVRAGADAVYLGLENFNARRNAENFNSDSIKDAVRFCHARNVSVYLTLNILIYNDELEEAVKTAIVGAEAGIDGIICADLGLAAVLKRIMPQMPLHASTQTTIHTADALEILKEIGFSRVVPSREMSREELKNFCKKAKELGLEVEVFVHGALCMCMSGQCLMSANLGGRSGNRGLCAGTCRLPFETNGGNGYALSLKDLSLIEYIPELKEMGVDSLKIEGRMKGAEYVAATTAACRKMLDEGMVPQELNDILKGVFSRSGFTQGYFNSEIDKDMFGTRTDENMNLSREIKNQTHELYRRERQNVGLRLKFEALKDRAIKLSLKRGNIEVEVQGSISREAKNKEIDKEYIAEKLKKFGGTQYFAEDIEIVLDKGLFCSASEIGELRRKAIEKLAETETENIKSGGDYAFKPQKRLKKEQKIIARFENIEEIPQNIENLAAIIVPAEKLDKINSKVPIIADIPAGMSDKKFIQKCFQYGEKASAVLCKNLAAVKIAKEKGIPFIFGSEMNVLNIESAKLADSLGAKGIILSTEIKLSSLNSFGDISPLGLIAYGKSNLMLTRNCPIKSGKGCKECNRLITDRKGISFPVSCRGGYSYIKNSRPLYLADRLEELALADFILLDFTDETKHEAQSIINQYLELEKIKIPKEYTRGLYYKGVQ